MCESYSTAHKRERGERGSLSFRFPLPSFFGTCMYAHAQKKNEARRQWSTSCVIRTCSLFPLSIFGLSVYLLCIRAKVHTRCSGYGGYLDKQRTFKVRPRNPTSGNKNLYIVDAAEGEFSGGIRQLTDGPWIDTMPSWSPKGDLIAFSSNRHNPKNPERFSIYVAKPDGSDVRRIYVGGKEGSDETDKEMINHVCFSKDGEWLLFTDNLAGVTAEPVSFSNQFQPYGDLHVLRLDGTGLRRLTCNAYENGTPMWHPGDEMDMGRLCLGHGVGDKVEGDFQEPLWISCDI